MVIGICLQKETAASYTNDIPDKKPPEKQERSSRGSRNQRQPCTVNNRIQNQRDDTGKDRTGVVSAILLKKLGFDHRIIIEDYMKTRENLLDFLTAYVREHPQVDLNTILPNEKNIKKVLDAI